MYDILINELAIYVHIMSQGKNRVKGPHGSENLANTLKGMYWAWPEQLEMNQQSLKRCWWLWKDITVVYARDGLHSRWKVMWWLTCVVQFLIYWIEVLCMYIWNENDLCIVFPKKVFQLSLSECKHFTGLLYFLKKKSFWYCIFFSNLALNLMIKPFH